MSRVENHRARLRIAPSSLALCSLALALLVAAPAARADDDDHDEHHHRERRAHGERGKGKSAAAPLRDAPATAEGPGLAAADGAALYAKECSACHLAYPPGLLPAASWRSIMGSLERHFAENAELPEAEARLLSSWLETNAAEARTHRRSDRVFRGLREEAPLRISELPYIRRKHHEVRAEVFARPAVASRANCAACHPGAEEGVFEEKRVKIPR